MNGSPSQTNKTSSSLKGEGGRGGERKKREMNHNFLFISVTVGTSPQFQVNDHRFPLVRASVNDSDLNSAGSSGL